MSYWQSFFYQTYNVPTMQDYYIRPSASKRWQTVPLPGSAIRFAGISLFSSLVIVGCGGGEHAASLKGPNVLFIIADDLNCYLGCYGHYLAQTPHLDRLAADGLLFLNAYCNFPLCGPTRASMMTGLYPDQNTIKENSIFIRDRLPDVTTMTHVFMEGGYTAARIGKIYHYNNPADIGTPGHDDPASWNIAINPKGRDKDDEPLIIAYPGLKILRKRTFVPANRSRDARACVSR